MEALSGNRYEHIHVRLTEAIRGFRHFRKRPLNSAPDPLEIRRERGFIFTCE